MKVSDKCIKLIESYEAPKGPDLTAYKDDVGVWTIGYGNTFYKNKSKVKQGDKITKEQAEDLFKEILGKFESETAALVKSDISQHGFDALVSFAYNVGIGNLKNSTLLKKININPNDPSIRLEFAKWNKGGGKVLAGLTRRRNDEANLYFAA